LSCARWRRRQPAGVSSGLRGLAGVVVSPPSSSPGFVGSLPSSSARRRLFRASWARWRRPEPAVVFAGLRKPAGLVVSPLGLSSSRPGFRRLVRAFVVSSGPSSCRARWPLGGVGRRWCSSRRVVRLSVRPSCRVVRAFVVSCRSRWWSCCSRGGVVWTRWRSSTVVTWHLRPAFRGCQ
jgi:hypothetical protein